MNNHYTYLRMYRKRSTLSLPDMAFLLNLSDYSNISRFERSKRSPNITALIVYHLLFNTPIEEFFGRQIQEIKPLLSKRVTALLDNLKDLGDGQDLDTKLSFLEETLARLTSDPAYAG